MPLISSSERGRVEALSKLHYCNPFLRERIAMERVALGAEFRDAPPVRAELDYQEDANLGQLGQRIEQEATRLRQRLIDGAEASERDLVVYEDLVLYLLYRRYRLDLEQTIAESSRRQSARVRIHFWDGFRDDFEHFLLIPGRAFPTGHKAAEFLADSFQLCRAFRHIFNNIIGTSGRTAKLRAAVWESIFTHDMRRYRRSLFRCMGDFPTLITGPSGTGKELVARAVALARYIEFNPKTQEFTTNYSGAFHALNLSALAATLIESELFGHKKGTFTGAIADREGWLEQCGPLSTVFLDEIGELDTAIQVKLLRVLEQRTFQRLGETKDRRFEGKIIAATNRDLAGEMRAHRFRHDLFFRLCADMITTPSLREQLDESPDDLRNLIAFIAKRIKGLPADEAEALAEEVEQWIHTHPILGREYSWPGNFRELEQCVRNVMIRKEYQPAYAAEDAAVDDPRRALAAAVQYGTLTLAEVRRQYCTLVFAQTTNYAKAAERLQIDRRTLKNRIDHDLLQGLRE